MAKTKEKPSILDELAKAKPSPSTIARARNLIRNIHKLMDGNEWDSDTTSGIAELLTDEGLEFRDPNEIDDDEEEPD